MFHLQCIGTMTRQQAVQAASVGKTHRAWKSAQAHGRAADERCTFRPRRARAANHARKHLEMCAPLSEPRSVLAMSMV